MKNAINYYYNLVTNDLHKRDDSYYFSINNTNYLLYPFYGNTNYLNTLYRFLTSNRIFCLTIVPNKDKQMVTVINNIPYIMLNSNINNNKININDILKYTIIIDCKEKLEWKRKWCLKLDYYEYQMEQYEKKYPLLSESFFYYDGLTETAISLLNLVNYKNVPLFISHNRIGKNTTLNDLYNPLNIIMDTKVRDIAEYYKNIFFYEGNPINEVHNFIRSYNLSYDEVILLLARFLYPSYYFDMYDEIINGKVQEDKIKVIINKVDEYETFLKNIYGLIKSKYNVPEIEWLKKT